MQQWDMMTWCTCSSNKKQFNIKTRLETLDHYVRSILNKFDPDDEIEVDIQEFDGKKIVSVKILDRVLN